VNNPWFDTLSPCTLKKSSSFLATDLHGAASDLEAFWINYSEKENLIITHKFSEPKPMALEGLHK